MLVVVLVLVSGFRGLTVDLRINFVEDVYVFLSVVDVCIELTIITVSLLVVNKAA